MKCKLFGLIFLCKKNPVFLYKKITSIHIIKTFNKCLRIVISAHACKHGLWSLECSLCPFFTFSTKPAANCNTGNKVTEHSCTTHVGLNVFGFSRQNRKIIDKKSLPLLPQNGVCLSKFVVFLSYENLFYRTYAIQICKETNVCFFF